MDLLNSTNLSAPCGGGGGSGDGNASLVGCGGVEAAGDGSPPPPPLWIFLALSIIPVWVMFGNFMVLMAVMCQPSLRTLSNYVIASLAFTDFLLALVVVPFGIYQVVCQRWELGLYVCLLWTGSDVFLSTTSILHLAAIAIHRYLGISHPLRVRSVQEMRHVALLLLPTWTVAFAIALPLIIQGAFYDASAVLVEVGAGVRLCGIFDRTFAVYSSMVSYFVPLAIMIFADLRSVQILRRNVKITVTENGRRSTSSHSLQSTDRIKPLTNQDLSLYEMTPSDSAVTVLSPMVDDACNHNHKGAPAAAGAVPGGAGEGEAANLMLTPQSTPSSEPRGAPAPAGGRKRSKSMGLPVPSLLRIYIGMLATRGLVKINSRERRAEKTLIWVFACFVVFWLPFFTTNLTYGICRHCHIPEDVFLTFTWLGYISSGVNPCIYTLLNRDFRNAFRRILTCRHSHRHRHKPHR